METPENVMNTYVINGLVDEYDTQRQLLDSNNVETRGNVECMIATRCNK